jgi:hypothetical protein
LPPPPVRARCMNVLWVDAVKVPMVDAARERVRASTGASSYQSAANAVRACVEALYCALVRAPVFAAAPTLARLD